MPEQPSIHFPAHSLYQSLNHLQEGIHHDSFWRINAGENGKLRGFVIFNRNNLGATMP